MLINLYILHVIPKPRSKMLSFHWFFYRSQIKASCSIFAPNIHSCSSVLTISVINSNWFSKKNTFSEKENCFLVFYWETLAGDLLFFFWILPSESLFSWFRAPNHRFGGISPHYVKISLLVMSSDEVIHNYYYYPHKIIKILKLNENKW